MKGIVFTEFLDLVEDKFGAKMVKKIISQSKLASKGFYNSKDTYSFSEMLQLLNNLNFNTKISKDDLLYVFAEHFFEVLKNSYPGLLDSYKSPIEMISSVENHIHVEVRKIHPDADLPTFTVEEKGLNSLTMLYKSNRAMHHFGLGLMNKTFDHFNTKAIIKTKKIKEDGTEVRFIIQKKIL